MFYSARMLWGHGGERLSSNTPRVLPLFSKQFRTIILIFFGLSTSDRSVRRLVRSLDKSRNLDHLRGSVLQSNSPRPDLGSHTVWHQVRSSRPYSGVFTCMVIGYSGVFSLDSSSTIWQSSVVQPVPVTA